MKRRCGPVLEAGAATTALLCVALSAGAVRAQPTAAELEPVVVTGSATPLRLFDTPYAISTIEADELRAGGWMVNLSEALTRIPGLTVNNRGNYAQDLQISSRGFGARATFGVRGLRLYTDGIPATMPDGSGAVSHFDLASAQRIEVLRGPFSALYGNSSGGVIALFSTPVRERKAELSLDLGAHDTRQWRASFETPLSHGWNARVGVADFRTDGWRPHSAARRGLVQARLGWHGERDDLVLLANAIEQPADDPLGLSRAQFEGDAVQTAPQAIAFDTRKTARQQQLGARWTRRHGSGLLQETALMAYAGRREVAQWLSIPPAPQINPSHSGGVIDLSRDYGGLDARAVWRLGGARLVTGIAHEHQHDARRGFENFVDTPDGPRLGVTGALRRDERNRAASSDVYAQAEIDVGHDLVATLGMRHGRVRFKSSDAYLANGDDSGSSSYRYTNPVAGLLWRASPNWNLYASAGRGFESPTLNEVAYRPDGLTGFNADLRAQTSRQFEVGAKWRSDDLRAAVDLAVFTARTGDEIAVLENVGGRSTFRNVGGTRRHGAELASRWHFSPAWRGQLALTWLDARYRDAFTTASATVAAGNRIAGTSPASLFAELAWQPATGPSWALEWTARGRTAVDDLNSDFAAGYGLLALRAQWTLKERSGGGIDLLARIENLTDRRYASSVIVNEGNGRFFEPAAGRSWMVGLRWRL